MPIREVTERPSIPRLGKIRLGYKDPERNNAPVNTPYFVVPPEVAEVYGEQPTELSIVFLSDETERIASQWYRAYNATNGLFCKGNGYTADALLDGDELMKGRGAISQPLPLNAWAHGATGNRKATQTIVRRVIDCPGKGYDGEPACPMFDKKGCKQTTFLQFAIRDVPGLGVYQLDTGSVISTKRIMGAIEMARMMLGSVAGVPMKLRREQVEVAPDGKKKLVWTVSLEVDTRYSLTQLIELRQGPVAAALLPPVDESGPEFDEDDEPIEGEVVQPEKPQPEREEKPLSAAPTDLLFAIEKRHGEQAKRDAIAATTRLLGTANILGLSNEDRALLSGVLYVRLEGIEHEHDPAYGPGNHYICRRCGDELKEPADQGALV